MWEAFLRGLTHFGVFTLNEARIYLAVMDGFLKPVATCSVPEQRFPLLPCWPARPGGAPPRCWPAIRDRLGRGAGSRCAARATALRFRLEVPVWPRHDPARDLGFGNGQGDFAKTGDFAFSKAKFDDSKWRTLNLPHDWAVELPFVRDEVQNSHGYKPLGRRYPETSVGWYRREFEIPASDLGRRISVEFDGAFRSVLIFVNGCFIGRNDNGYAPFRFDLTDFLSYGAKNYIVARVDASFGDGWFYEGAGIYRHVWLTKTDALHLGKWESTVRTEVSGDSATLTLGTVVQNEGKQAENAKVSWQILDAAGKTVATAEAASAVDCRGRLGDFHRDRKLANPALWSVDAPNLYSAIVTVEAGGKRATPSG
jgi:beta-galactosidase